MNHLAYDIDVSVHANGDVLPDVLITINGVKSRRPFPKATNHMVYYLTIIDCLGDAIQRGATSVDIKLGDTTAARQMNGQNAIRKPHLICLHQAVNLLIDRLPSRPIFR